MEITYYETVKTAVFLFYDGYQNLKEEWNIHEKDFKKWFGTSNPKEETLHGLAQSYMKDWGCKRGYAFYLTYFEEVDA